VFLLLGRLKGETTAIFFQPFHAFRFETFCALAFGSVRAVLGHGFRFVLIFVGLEPIFWANHFVEKVRTSHSIFWERLRAEGVFGLIKSFWFSTCEC
jgi:hypothetical protein